MMMFFEVRALASHKAASTGAINVLVRETCIRSEGSIGYEILNQNATLLLSIL